MSKPSPSPAVDASDARERIVRAAGKHFFVHGFRRVTMDDLARSLGMSKKTLYSHFPSKADLLRALLLDKFRRIEADLEAVVSESADVQQSLRRLLATVQRQAAEIHPPFLRDIERDAPELFQLVEERRKQFIERHFGELFARGRREGIIRKDIPVRTMIEILLGAVHVVVSPAKLHELGLTPKAAIAAILTVVLEGVVTERARSER
jgi:AcrR family transcriptional regulator